MTAGGGVWYIININWPSGFWKNETITTEELGESRDAAITFTLAKEDKVEIFGYLDEKGVFRIKIAVEWAVNNLGVSKYAIYSYLEESRVSRQIKKGGGV